MQFDIGYTTDITTTSFEKKKHKKKVHTNHKALYERFNILDSCCRLV